MSMTPRERFYLVTSHPPKWADRVCIEFPGASITTNIVDQPPYGYRALCEFLGINDYAPPRSHSVWGGVLNIDERILEKFNVDFRYLPRGEEPPEVLPNGYIRVRRYFGMLWKSAYGRYSVVPDKETPARYLKTIEEIDDYPYWPDTESTQARRNIEQKAEELGKAAKKLHEETDYVISATPGSYDDERYRWIRGFDQWVIDMKKNPEFYHAFANKMLQVDMDKNEIVLNAIGDYIDRAMVGDDYGTQRGGMISLKDFREFCKPYHKKSFDLIRKYSKAKIQLHSCGSIHMYIKDFVDIGLDIIGQQIGFAKDMEPEKLKGDFGDMITFWGGMDTQRALVHWTPAQVKEWTKKCISILSPGYIIASNHTIERDTPPENIWAVHEAIEELTQSK